MLLKLGVHIRDLKRVVRRQFDKIENIWARYTGFPPVISSTNEGSHSPSSLHYANLAIDFSLPYGLTDIELIELVDDLKVELGSDFDVVLEKHHIHIEYDPD